MTQELLNAIDMAVAGQWDAAHRIVQQYEDDRIAAMKELRSIKATISD